MASVGSQNEQQAAAEARITSALDSIGTVYLVLSGKGGVGKSTVAARTAGALARQGYRTGLLDLDLHGPSIPGLLGLEGEKVQADEHFMHPVGYRENLHVMSVGFLLEHPDDAVIWRGPMKAGVIRQFLSDVGWGDLDYLVVDSPPGTGDEPLTIAQLTAAKAQAIIVTTPQKIAVDDVRKSIRFCERLDIPIAGIIENMSGYVCPHCGELSEIFSTGGGKALAETADVPFLGAVPVDSGIMWAGDRGELLANGDEGVSRKAFDTITGKLIPNK